MESPILSPDIIKLGKKLKSEFARHERSSPTIKWVTQYLAQLIARIENAADEDQKRADEKEAMEIILKLWRNKEELPHEVRPLDNLKDVLDVLDALKSGDPDIPHWQRHRNLEQASPWGKFIAQTRHDSQTIFQITANLVLGADILKKEKEWTEFPGMLSADEAKLIADLDWLVSEYSASAMKNIFKAIGPFDQPEPPTDRINAAFDKMDQLLQAQLKTVASLRVRMLKGKKSK